MELNKEIYMQKTLAIDNIKYELFTTTNNKSVEEYLLDSRTYNSGLDAFLGSDCISVYAYLVKKNNVAKFIDEINQFIDKVENLNIVKEYDYLESVNDFSFMHKPLDNSQYDVFLTHFDMNMCHLDSYDVLLDEHESFMERVAALSDFSILAGAEYNDESIADFALSYLAHKNKKIVVEVFKDFEDDLEYYLDNDFEDFPITINTKDKKIIPTFIKLYFSNLPKSIQDPSNFYGLINECAKQI
jgi:hypothetical protein